MAGNALQILKISRYCERFAFWNGMDQVAQKWGGGGGKPAPPPSSSPCAAPANE